MKLKNLFQYSLRHPSAVIPFLLSLPKYIKLYLRLLKDPRVPLWPKLVFWAGVLYALSPWDFLPDFLIPILGWTDDVIIFIAAARYFLRACPREVVMEHAVAMGGRLS